MTEVYPLQWPKGWPRTANDKLEGPHRFKTRDFVTGNMILPSFGRSRDRLLEEVRRLGGRSIVISCNHQPGRDGIPQERTRVTDQGIAVYFLYQGRQMVMACDKFITAAANMSSLRLAIEALRQLERHGGGHMMERAFAGFAALPPPAGEPEERPVIWREEFGPLPEGLEPGDLLAIVERRFRDKAKAAHPDGGGSGEQMIRLNAAIAQARSELGA